MSIEFSKTTVDEAKKDISKTRKGGGRSSMYDPVIDEALELDKGEVITLVLDGYNRVQGLRSALDRRAEETFEVKSTKHEDDKDKEQADARYKCWVFRVEDVS